MMNTATPKTRDSDRRQESAALLLPAARKTF
jgi:hypothetical protein